MYGGSLHIVIKRIHVLAGRLDLCSRQRANEEGVGGEQ